MGWLKDDFMRHNAFALKPLLKVFEPNNCRFDCFSMSLYKGIPFPRITRCIGNMNLLTKLAFINMGIMSEALLLGHPNILPM